MPPYEFNGLLFEALTCELRGESSGLISTLLNSVRRFTLREYARVNQAYPKDEDGATVRNSLYVNSKTRERKCVKEYSYISCFL